MLRQRNQPSEKIYESVLFHNYHRIAITDLMGAADRSVFRLFGNDPIRIDILTA